MLQSTFIQWMTCRSSSEFSVWYASAFSLRPSGQHVSGFPPVQIKLPAVLHDGFHAGPSLPLDGRSSVPEQLQQHQSSQRPQLQHPREGTTSHHQTFLTSLTLKHLLLSGVFMFCVFRTNTGWSDRLKPPWPTRLCSFWMMLSGNGQPTLLLTCRLVFFN